MKPRGRPLKKIVKPKYKQKMPPLSNDELSIPRWDWARWMFPGVNFDTLFKVKFMETTGILLSQGKTPETFENKDMGLHIEFNRGKGITVDFQGRYWLLSKNEEIAVRRMMEFVEVFNRLGHTKGHLTRVDACRDFWLPSVFDVLPLAKIIHRTRGDNAYFWSFLTLYPDNMTHSSPFNRYEEIWIKSPSKVLRIYNKTAQVNESVRSPVMYEAYRNLWQQFTPPEEANLIRVEVGLKGKNQLANLTRNFYHNESNPKEAFVMWASSNGIYRWTGKGKKNVSRKTKQNHWEICPRFREVFLTFGNRKQPAGIKKLPALVDLPVNINRRLTNLIDACVQNGLCLPEVIDMLKNGFPRGLVRKAEQAAGRDIIPSILGWTGRSEDREAVGVEPANRGTCNHPQTFPTKERFYRGKILTHREYSRLYPDDIGELECRREEAIQNPVSEVAREHLIDSHLKKLIICEDLAAKRYIDNKNKGEETNNSADEDDGFI